MKKLLIFLLLFPLLSFTDKNYEAFKSISTVSVNIIYVTGYSPSVFNSGWVFSASGIDNITGADVSDKIEWSGTFESCTKSCDYVYPVFSNLGPNEITLTCLINGSKIKRTYRFNVVNSDMYAAVGDIARCQEDSHGCTGCPHTVKGPITTGSPTIKVRNKPAARMGDTGIHKSPNSCCGQNTFTIIEGDPTVLIDGTPAARIMDMTQHCGGVGRILDYGD